MQHGWPRVAGTTLTPPPARWNPSSGIRITSYTSWATALTLGVELNQGCALPGPRMGPRWLPQVHGPYE